MTARTGADVIAEALAAAGATHAFGIPGGEVLALVEALERAGIEFVLTKHENSAGFMAEGLWHATGALPVLVATLGPGVANAVNVVANAGQDRVPMVFLTGCVDADIAGSYTHQVFDHQAVLRPLVKASLRADPGAIAPATARAVALAREGQPGPVHLDVPIGAAERPSDEQAAVPPPPRPGPADGACLAAAREILAGATRPLAIVGVDAVNAGAGPAVTAFCRAAGTPVIATYKAKGLMPDGDPLVVGAAGLSPRADGLLLPLVAAADALVLIGYDPIEMRAGWRHPWPAATPAIEVTPVARCHGMHTACLTLQGDIAATLDRLAPDAARATWPDGAPAATASRMTAAFAPAESTGPLAVFRTLRELLPPDAVLTADSGAHRILLSQAWVCPAPRTLLQSTGLCTMACAVPLAAGHRLGRPEVPVVAVVGDAGLEMGLGELATLRDRGLPVIVVVLVDGSLALIEMKQRAAGRPCAGVDFPASDFPAVARALGGEGFWIDDPADLTTRVPAALARKTFTVLACRIDRRAYDGTF